MVDQQLKDVLNAGIGLWTSLNSNLQLSAQDIEAKFQEYVAKGQADNSDAAQKLRSTLDQGIVAFSDVQNKIMSAIGKSKDTSV